MPIEIPYIYIYRDRDRGKRLRLPSCLLIETDSTDALSHPAVSCSSRFRCRLATTRKSDPKVVRWDCRTIRVQRIFVWADRSRLIRGWVFRSHEIWSAFPRTLERQADSSVSHRAYHFGCRRLLGPGE